ncbi:O-antigen/teichoic acid export membrane protein [Nocardioides perillae]|uniref:O-antigen/teichoic acid export membrane protein n=1 Tax=Nocardioides perillae TaxID=1119534 RepID=A0A7Y9RQZ1_9ACTN|nr:O-antigen/teichoic acid export membrane protein [Nocardioides perillae]
MAIVLWVATLSTVSLLGGQQAIIYFGRQSSSGVGRAVTLVRSSWVEIALCSAALAAIVLWLTSAHSSRAILTLLATAIIPISAIVQALLSGLLSDARLSVWNAVRLVPAATYAMASLLLLSLEEFSIVTGLVALTVGNAAALVAVLVVVGQRGPLVPDDATPVGEMKSYGRRSLMSSLPAMLRGRTDQLVLAAVAAPSVLGVYAVAASVAAVADVVSVTVGQLAFPRFVEDARLRTKARRLATTAIALTLIAIIPVAAGGDWLIRHVYGPAYVPAADPLSILLVAAAVKVGIAFLSAESQALDKLRLLGLAHSSTLIATGMLVATLVPVWGMTGAASAVLIGQVACLSVLWLGVRQVSAR